MKTKTFACLGLLSLLAACGSGGLGLGGSCEDLKDRASCVANSACVPVGCATSCADKTPFSHCYDKDNAPALKCAPLGCPPGCSQYSDAASCLANGCETASCPDCAGGSLFGGCHEPGTSPIPVCPAFCPPPDCSQHTDELSCAADSACHAVFRDAGDCLCAQPGCCTSFNHCAGGPAVCNPTPPDPSGGICDALPPVCEGEFVIDYSDPCPSGCVRQAVCNDCRSKGCDEGTCQPCWSTYECLPAGVAC